MTKIPALGGLAGMINSAIQDTYGKIKSQRFQNATNAINKIIMDNYSQDQLHRTIARAALEIAERKQGNVSPIL